MVSSKESNKRVYFSLNPLFSFTMQVEHEPREGEPDDLVQADPIADIIEKLSGGNKQSKILDVGAGTGLSGARVRIIQWL